LNIAHVADSYGNVVADMAIIMW